MEKYIYIVTELCYEKEILCALEQDNYFYAGNVRGDVNVNGLRGLCLIEIIPDNDLVGLGESQLFSLNIPPLATKEMQRILREVYQNNLPLLNYDIDQWLMFLKELIWDHGMNRVGIYYYYKGNAPSICHVKNISIEEVSRYDIIHLKEHVLLNVCPIESCDPMSINCLRMEY